MADAAELEQAIVATHFRNMAEGATLKLPLYRRVCEAAASDPEVLDLLCTAGPSQQRPMLLLAAVHDQVLAGVDHELAGWYPSLSDEPRPVGEPGSADDPWPAFRDLALSSPQVAELVATRSTQTNEVNRCGALLPAFTTVAATTGRPLGLVELGASAGLNLHFDRYSYDYGDGTRFDPGSGRSTVDIDTESRGPEPVPVPASDEGLDIMSRSGIDLDPVDLDDDAATRWLLACTWPEQEGRMTRLRNAILLAKRDQPNVVQGDLVEDVPGLVESVGPDAEPVLFATWVLTYLRRDQQASLFTALDVLGATRDVSLVFAERLDEVPALPSPKRADGIEDPRYTALVWVRWHDGRRIATRLGDLHPHGSWLAWTHPGG